MNPSFSSDWSREEKEEYATKRMNEMKLKNEKFKQRHAEVEKDRLEAEKKCSAVTSGAKILPKTPDSIEEKHTSHCEPRKQREWDIGKSTNDNDWYPPTQQDYHPSQDSHDSRVWTPGSDWCPSAQKDYHRSQDYHYSRQPRRGGFYDKRRERQDNAWRSRGSRSVSFRGSYSKNRGSNQSRSNAFQSGNASNYSKESNKNSFKTSNESSFKTSSNWKDSRRNAFYSGSTFSKTANKSDSDKMWHDDGLNEVQNKQSRVEKWVKSINKVEDWSEGDEKPCKNYKNIGMGRSFENCHDKEQDVWGNEGDLDSGAKKHFSQNKTKYEKPFEHSFSKNVSTYGDKITHASDLDHHGIVGKKTSSYGYKRDIKPKYNHGVSSYDKIEVSNLKNDPKTRKESRYSKNKDFGADIWDYENTDESKNKFSDSKTELDSFKHGHPNKNRDSRSATWDYKEADNFDSKTRPEIRKKEYNRSKNTESDIWGDCEQTNDWGSQFETKSGSGVKEQDNLDSGSDAIWDYAYGDNWDNKVIDLEIESNVKTQNSCKNNDSESVGWDYEKKDDLKVEYVTKEHENCDISNNFENVLTDNKEVEIKTSEKNYHEENRECEEDICNEPKEISFLTKKFNNVEIDSDSISEHKTNDSNKITNSELESSANKYHCNESMESAFVTSDCKIIDNSKNELTEFKAEFTEYTSNDKSKNPSSAEQNLNISLYSASELNDLKAEAEIQEHNCNIGSNEPGFAVSDYENTDKIENTDLKSELIEMEQVPCLSINEDSPFSGDNSIASNPSVSHESNELIIENSHSVEKDKKIILKEENNLSCATDENFTINSNNSISLINSKLSESNELLQQSICKVENKNSNFSPVSEEKQVSSFSEISSENVSCDIISNSSPDLSQGSVKDDDLSPHTDMDITESTKNVNENVIDISALHLSDDKSPVDTNESDVKILNNI